VPPGGTLLNGPLGFKALPGFKGLIPTALNLVGKTGPFEWERPYQRLGGRAFLRKF